MGNSERRSPIVSTLTAACVIGSLVTACGPKSAVNQDAFHDANAAARMLEAELTLQLEEPAPPFNPAILSFAVGNLVQGAKNAMKSEMNSDERALLDMYEEAVRGVHDGLRVLKWESEIRQVSGPENLPRDRVAVVDLNDVIERYGIETYPGPWDSTPLEEMRRRLSSGSTPEHYTDERLLAMRVAQRTFDPDETVRLIWQRTKETLSNARTLYEQPAR